MTARLKSWRIQRTRDKIDDTEAYLDAWGFARTPSEKRKLRARIERLEAKLERLSA